MKITALPLHPAQLDVYTDQLVNINSPHYNVGGYIRLKGLLDKAIFHQVIDSLPEVFDAFRMRFFLDEGEPKVCPGYIDKTGALSELDFTVFPDPFQTATGWMQSSFNEPFALSNEHELLYYNRLLKLADGDYIFYGKYHHLLTDGYGFIVLVQYIAKKYRSLVANDDLTFHYPSYMEEIQRSSGYFLSAEYQSDEDYWRQKIGTRPAGLLQPKYNDQQTGSNDSGVYTQEISLTERNLLEHSQETTNAGLQHLTIAALLIYFGKTSSQSRFVFGIPVHKRNSKKLRNIIGMFSGILPLEANYQPEKSILELVKEIVLSQRSDYRHQQYPIGRLNRQLNIKGDEGYLQEITVNYEPFDFEVDFGSEVQAGITRLTTTHERNPLQLSWRDYGAGQPLRLFINYSHKYFNEAEIGLFAGRLLFIISQFPNCWNKKAGAIEVVPTGEFATLHSFNQHDLLVPATKSLAECFVAQVQKTPTHTALIFEKAHFTYQELNERANQLAHYLLAKGVTSETLVPLFLERSPEMIVAMLAVLKSGGAYVPIDPNYPVERIAFILEDTHASICICSLSKMDRLSSFNNLELIFPGDEVIRSQPTIDPLTTVLEKQLAYVIYTSGSTGRPKGVMIEQHTVAKLIQAQTAYFNINATDRILQFSNYCFDASVEQIYLALFNGAALVLFKEGHQLALESFQQFLFEERITHLHATPSYLDNLTSIDTTYLKRVIAGGDLCKISLAEYWKHKVSFYNEYGPTETTVTAVTFFADPHVAIKTNTLPIGKPLANTRVYIVDASGNLCPVGVSGEIYIGGDCVARGYLNRPELTSEKFIADPFNSSQSGKLYKSGDIGCWLPDGNILYQGRMDEQVKVRGYRVELGEIENVLQEYAGVKQAFVLARGDNNGSNRLVAYVVPGENFDRGELQQYMRTKLPEYMVPTQLIEVPAIPLTPNGKPDRAALPEPGDGVCHDTEFVSPRNEMESQLAGLWQEVLTLVRIGVRDNFFEAGGHSLNAIQLITRIHKTLGYKIEVGDIFANPTIELLAAKLALVKPSSFQSITPLAVQPYYPLSHAQERFWVLSHFESGSAAYNVSNAFTISGGLKIPAFKKAFHAVIGRHEILRTVFIEVDGKAHQKIIPANEINFGVNHYNLVEDPTPEATIKSWMDKDSKTAFDLVKGPLLRATLFTEAADTHTLVVNIHHIISDGWSKGIFIREFLHFYQAFSTNENIDLAALPIQYKDYAAWHSASFHLQGKYWKDLYKDTIPVLNFPLDFERPKVLTFFGAMVQASIPRELRDKLQKIAAGQGSSLNNLFISLYALIVARYSNQEDVVVGSLTSGRSHADLENLVGVFINFLPVRFFPKKDQSLSDYLKASQQSLLEVYKNQDYPFDLMVAGCIKERDVSRNPFFDTMLNFHLESFMNAAQNLTGSPGPDAGIKISPKTSLQDELFQSVLDFKLDIELASDNSLELYLSYNTRLFRPETMQAFLTDFIELLNKVADDPGKILEDYGGWNLDNVNEQTQASADTPLPMVLCGSFVLEPMEEVIGYWSTEVELGIALRFAPYNQVFQQLLDNGSLLNENTGMNVLFIRLDDWVRAQNELSIQQQIKLINQTHSDLVSALQQSRQHSKVPCLISIVPLLDPAAFSAEVVVYIDQLNKDLQLLVEKTPGYHLIDLDLVAGLYSIEDVYDAKSDEHGHMPFTQEYYAALGTYLARKVNAFKGPAYKVLALDCDNTLWKGICGELGACGVLIDENFQSLQDFFIKKYQEGFLLVLCSKNNEADVWEVFDRHPAMKLKREHIAAHRINWNPKSANLKSIARELNLGVNSFIFLDDSEFEIGEVSAQLPEVLSITLPADDTDYESFLQHIWAFDYFHVTEEDTRRNELYKVEKERRGEADNFNTVTEFLNSLNIQVNILPLSEINLERAVQLTLRTNQFNLNGIRKTAEDIARRLKDEKAVNWVIEVRDRFGEYGIVGLLLANQADRTLTVDTFLLSCRVLGRNVEDRVLAALLLHCDEQHLEIVRANYIATTKNKPFGEFLVRTAWQADPRENTYYRLLNNIEQTIAG